MAVGAGAEAETVAETEIVIGIEDANEIAVIVTVKETGVGRGTTEIGTETATETVGGIETTEIGAGILLRSKWKCRQSHQWWRRRHQHQLQRQQQLLQHQRLH